MASLKKSAAQKVELLFVLKGQLDLIYKQLNHFRGAYKSVDKLNRSVKGLLESDTEVGQLATPRLFTEFVKFERNYRYWRKRFRKLDRRLLNVDVNDQIYELYESLMIDHREQSKRLDKRSQNANGTKKIAENNDSAVITIDSDNGEIVITENDIEVKLETSGNLNNSSRETRQQRRVNTATANVDLSTIDTSILVHEGSKTKKVRTQQCRKLKFYRCEFEGCKFTANDAWAMNRHKTSHSNRRPFKCDKCEWAFKVKGDLKQHQTTHDSNRNSGPMSKVLRCEFEGCQYSTKSSANMRRHQTKHSDHRPFQCDQCDARFKVKGVLKAHQNIHQQNKSKRTDRSGRVLRCEFEDCQYTAKEAWTMNIHKTSHSDERPFQCDKCDWAFKSKSNLKAHQTIHEGKRFQCTFEGCTATYAHKGDIREHVQKVHTKEAPLLRCDWEGCEYSTYRSYNLQIHRMNHTGDRPYKCAWPGCDQSFVSSSRLNKHQLIHEDPNRYKCSWEGCDYSTYTTNNLQKHQIVHTGERPHKCPDCDQSFKSSATLRNHKLIHERVKTRLKCSWEGCQFISDQSETLSAHLESSH